MFDIPVMPVPRLAPPRVNVETKVETRPTFNTTLELRDHDPHDVKLAARVEKGRVNKAVTVRR